MSYVGDIRLGDTLDVKFTTRQASGAPTTLAGSPVISAYVGNSTTEITAGITLTVDFDSRTGLNQVRVVASGGNGFATASNYQLVITTGTVNGVSVVAEVIGEFSIEARSALMPATAARTLVVDAAGLADANTVKLGPTGAGTAQTARDVGGNVDVATSTRMATYTQPTGFLAATFPGGTVANTTNITAGTMTTTTNLTNAPTAGDFTAVMKTSLNAATPAVTVSDKTGFSLTAAYDPAKTASQAGDAMALTGGERTTLAGVIWGTVITGTTTAIQAMRGYIAAMLGKASGLGTTTAKYRNIADSKDVITATVDADGNRSAVTLDLT